jgi:DNA-directed RNA polymerase specialized sigma24 family protein
VVALHYLEDLSVGGGSPGARARQGTVKAQLHTGRETLDRILALLLESVP